MRLGRVIKPLAKVRGFFISFDVMVDVVQVREASYRITKISTSGYDALDEFIGKANEVNIDAMNLLTPHYGKVKAVDDILNTFVKRVGLNFTGGAMVLPEDFYGYISTYKTTTVNGVDTNTPVRKIKTNQIGTLGQHSIRKPTQLAPKIYLSDGNVIAEPANPTNLTMVYFRLPADVSITTTPVEGETDDYEEVTAQTDYEWPPRMKNLLIYLLVERLGGEMKQPILFEIAQMGIQNSSPIEPVQ